MKFKKSTKRIISFILAVMLMLDIPFMTNFIDAKASERSYPISLNSRAQYIADTYANVEKIVYGKSVMGRDLEAYVINGLGYNDRTIFCNFAVHGFEDFYFRDGQELTRAANYLIEYIAQNPYLIKNCRIIIIPCANPDGAIDGVNNLRTGSDAFGRNTAEHVDINRDFIDFEGQETRALRDLMIQTNPYIYLDFHGWLNSVLGDGFLVDAFRSTNNLRRDQTGAFGTTKGYAIGYAKKHLGAYSALVEFESPETLNYVNIANGIAKSIDYLPHVASKWGINRYGWCYTDANGNMARSHWITDYLDWCYVDSNGTMITNAWQMDSMGWCYVDGDGHLVRNSWIAHPKGMCYVDEEGHSISGRWAYIDGSWYYFNGEGYMMTERWIKDYRDWCYVDSTGKMLTNTWQQDYKALCYVDGDGHLVRSALLEHPDGKRYVDGEGHSLSNRWVYLDDEWSYFDSDGFMATNSWAQDYKALCYVDNDGRLVRNALLEHPDGKRYVDEEGHSVDNRWVTIDNSSYYFNKDGFMVTNDWQTDDTGRCYLGADGKKVINDWVESNDNRYYMDADGHMTVGWLELDTNRYYFFEDGSMALGKQTIDGVEYDFGTDGIAKEIEPSVPEESNGNDSQINTYKVD